jgi:DNA repair exonuclease SbcCD ATPase subunit
MSDIDRLKRDLQLETARRQEMERREEANKSSMVQLAAEVVNLERAREGDVAVLERRSRKVEELRMELEAERGRRIRAEEEASASRIEAEARVANAEAVVEGTVSRQEQAQTELAVQQSAHAALHVEYAARTTIIERSFGEVLQEAEVARLKTTRLDVVLEQMQVELERTTRANEAMGRRFEEYRAIKEQEVDRLRKKAEANEGEDRRQREEAAKVLEDARWLITMGKRSVGSEGQRS